MMGWEGNTQEEVELPDPYFGGCPHCLEEKGKVEDAPYLNIRKAHFAYCDEHKVYWVIGVNLFSSWQYEDPEVWEANNALLSGFREVERVYNTAEKAA